MHFTQVRPPSFRCLLLPRKQTLTSAPRTSALCQQQSFPPVRFLISSRHGQFRVRSYLGFNPAPRLEHIAISLPSACRIANIAPSDAMILPDNANPSWIEISESTGVRWRTTSALKRTPATLVRAPDFDGLPRPTPPRRPCHNTPLPRRGRT